MLLLYIITLLFIRLEDLDEEKNETDAMFNKLEVDVDNLRKELYKDFQPEIQEMTPIDADSEQTVIERPPPPASGELQNNCQSETFYPGLCLMPVPRVGATAGPNMLPEILKKNWRFELKIGEKI